MGGFGVEMLWSWGKKREWGKEKGFGSQVQGLRLVASSPTQPKIGKWGR